MVLPPLTSQGVSVFRIDWPARWQSLPFTACVPQLHWLSVRFRILFKINLLTYKTLREKQLVSLPSMLAAPLPSRVLRSNKGISVSVSRVKTSTEATAFHSCAPSLGTTSRCLSVQPFQLLPSRNIWRHISLTWPFHQRNQHTQWPVDVTELFLWFCCWTLVQLLRHWAWLCWGYWCFRNLIDWLIDDAHWQQETHQGEDVHCKLNDDIISWTQ